VAAGDAGEEEDDEGDADRAHGAGTNRADDVWRERRPPVARVSV